MSAREALARLGGGRALRNAREASAELARLRREREEVRLFLERAGITPVRREVS